MTQFERDWSNLDEDIRILTNQLEDALEKLKAAKAQFKEVRSRIDDLYQKVKENSND